MEKQLFHLTLLLFNFLGIQGLSAQCSDLFISEYQEGSSYNKAVEVYNPTADSIDFTDYELQLFSNGSNSASQTFTSSHIIPAYSTYVIVHNSADSSIKVLADTISSSIANFNGDDAIALINTSTGDTLDVIGEIGIDPGSSWSVSGTNSTNGSTANRTLVRDTSIQKGNKNWLVSSTSEWMVFAQDMDDSLGMHTANCPDSVSAFSSSITIDSLVSCNGGSDGGATVFSSGGTAPYTYLWSNSDTNSSITGLSAGNYYVTVTDAASATIVDTAIITEPASLTASITVDSNVSCNGGGDGKLYASGIGGTVPYTYAWSNSATTDSLNNVIAGLYSVTITDSNGCVAVDSALVGQPSALSTAITVVKNVSTNGGSDGKAYISATGGTSPYTYNWSNSSQSDTINNLTAGSYVVTVTDANGCSAVDSVRIIEPPKYIANLVITEILYNAAESGTDTTEYIEILNADTAKVALNGFNFPDGITHTFGAEDSIEVGHYAIIAYDSSAFRNRYGFNADFIWTTGELSNSGELIVLADQFGRSIDSVDYDDASPWPSGSNAGEPDGGGASIELVDSSLNNNLGQNWVASTVAISGQIINGLQVYGTPGKGSIIVGVEDKKQRRTPTLKVFPNPTNGVLNIEYERSITIVDNWILIYNLKGKLVYKQQISNESKTLDISNLNKGVYFIRFQHETKKLIVVK